MVAQHVAWRKETPQTAPRIPIAASIRSFTHCRWSGADDLLYPAAAVDGEVVFDNGGLVRASKETGERLLFEVEPTYVAVVGDKLWAMTGDSLIEVDKKSWLQEPTFVNSTLSSPIARPNPSPPS